jgi:hypothetical protein
VESLVKRVMRERGISFKEAVNEAIRSGLAPGEAEPFETPTHRMGFDPAVRWDKALRLAAELEDDELMRRLASRK